MWVFDSNVFTVLCLRLKDFSFVLITIHQQSSSSMYCWLSGWRQCILLTLSGCLPQRSQHLLIWRTMGSLMSCHLRAQSPCPGHGPCESNITYLGKVTRGHFSHTHTQKHNVWAVQFAAAFCFPSWSYLFCCRAAMNSMCSQHCRPISTQSITSTDSADSEENYVAMVSPNS